MTKHGLCQLVRPHIQPTKSNSIYQ